MRRRFDLAAAVSALLVALGMLMAVAGCASPVEPEQCGPCAGISVVAPSAAEVNAAQALARQQAVATCPSVIRTDRPAVVFLSCPVWVSNAISSPGGSPHGTCAAGLCRMDRDEVWVSLADPARVVPLITWETRNWYWTRSGCGDQAY